MKKTKLLTPLMTLGTLGAIVTPMTILTSCSGANTGANANLAKDYQCEVKPADKVTYETAAEAIDAYIDAISASTNDSNAADYKILKDDARFSYSLAFKTNTFKKIIGGNLSSYTLDFSNVSVDKANKTMDVTFNIKVKGTFHDGDLINCDNADFECTFRMNNGFDIEFHAADDLTCEKRNYISCGIKSDDATYSLKGTFKLDGVDYTIDKKDQSTTISEYPTKGDKDAYCVYIAKQFILTGVSCNYKDLSSMMTNGGCLYTNYMSLAEIKAE